MRNAKWPARRIGSRLDLQALTDKAVRNAKPGDKPYKISDCDGLYLLVNTTGKYWRFNYRFAGKQKTLALGV